MLPRSTSHSPTMPEEIGMLRIPSVRASKQGDREQDRRPNNNQAGEGAEEVHAGSPIF